METLNLARQTTNLLCSNFSASRNASVEAATPSSWRWKNQALAFSHSLFGGAFRSYLPHKRVFLLRCLQNGAQKNPTTYQSARASRSGL